MSKVFFRARALDATKPLPIYYGDELPDLPDFTPVSRQVPQMPTGMEKEEELVRAPFVYFLFSLRHFKMADTPHMMFCTIPYPV